MNKDIKRFFIDKEMVGKAEVEEKHECDCNGECGGDCKCHKEEEIKIDINDIIAKGELGFEAPADWIPSSPNDFHLKPLDLVDEMKEIPIRYLEGAKELVINPKGNCIDVYAYEDVFIPYMSYCMINLGFAMQLPEGKIAKLYPRSSTFKKYGLIQTNHCGIIDETYCSNTDVWHLPVQCTMPKQVDKVEINGKKITVAGTWIKKDDSIAQFEIVDAMEMPTFKKVDDLGNIARGSSSVYDEYDKCGKSEY